MAIWASPLIRGASGALLLVLGACGEPAREVPNGPIPGVAQSDDYDLFGQAFEAAARSLIADGTCVVEDFIEMAGFTRSPSRRGDYFTYCYDGIGTSIMRITIDDRLYVTPSATGTFRISR